MNLSEHQITSTTNFFNSLDTDNDGFLSIQQIIDACVQNNLQATEQQQQFKLYRLQQLSLPSVITKEIYENAQTTAPFLFVDFSEIDTDNNNEITLEQLYEKYTQTNDAYYPSKSFITLIKETYNLTNESQVSLQQLLEYENAHNITRIWPSVSPI